MIAVFAVGASVSAPAVAGKFLTKSKAGKLFLDQAEAGALFLDQAEAGAQFLDEAEGEGLFLDQSEGDAAYVNEGSVNSSWSCDLHGFLPTISTGVEYGVDQFAGRTTTVPAQYTCNAELPDGGTITSVAFSMYDNSTTEHLEACALRKTYLATSIGTTAYIGPSLATGGGLPGPAPGAVRETSGPLSEPIDNDAFSYAVACSIIGNGTDVGIIGATVTYTAPAGSV